jgi:hypothetical protein
MQLATQIAKHMDLFGLAFKSYNVSDFDGMMETIGGTGARVSGKDTSDHLKTTLLERGFTIYPSIAESEDGYVRVIRANSIVGSLLNAFRYVGPNGDRELVRLLQVLKRRLRPDDLENTTDE